MISMKGLLIVVVFAILVLGPHGQPKGTATAAANKSNAVSNIAPLPESICSCGVDCGPPHYCTGECSGDYGFSACITCISRCCDAEDIREGCSKGPGGILQ